MTNAQISRCQTDGHIVQAFLDATDGNWRNALYIQCTSCKYSRPAFCSASPDILYVPAADGTPIFLPVSDAEILFARRLDLSECLLSCSNLRFQALFQRYLPSPQPEHVCCPLAAVCLKNVNIP